MISPNECMDAVEAALGELLPGETVYRDITPKEFKRPAALVTCGAVKLTDASRESLWVEASFSVMLFAPMDRYYNCERAELTRRMMALLTTLSAEPLRVSGRALRANESRGSCNFDFAEVGFTLRYQDERPGARDWPLISAAQITVTPE